MPHPYVLLSAAVSLDGFLDDTGPERLLLSGPADFDRVDEVRASSDAILVGAGTLRSDNPRLLVNSAERRAARVAAGRPEYPLKVTVSGSGDLDPDAQFWHTGGEKVVYTTDKGAERAAEALRGLDVDVVPTGPELDWPAILEHLYDVRGVRRLMVEGGGRVHTQLVRQGLADELQLAVAPLFVGEADAPRLFGPGGTRPAGCGWWRHGRSATSSSSGTSPRRRASVGSPPRRTGTGWGSPASSRRCVRRPRPRSVSGRWWWRPTGPSWRAGTRGKGTILSCTPRRRRSGRSIPRIRALAPPPCTAVWSRVPGGRPGPRPVRG